MLSNRSTSSTLDAATETKSTEIPAFLDTVIGELLFQKSLELLGMYSLFFTRMGLVGFGPLDLPGVAEQVEVLGTTYGNQ